MEPDQNSMDEYDPSIQEEWIALAKKRMEQIATGEVVGIPADEAIQSLMDALRGSEPHGRDGRSPR